MYREYENHARIMILLGELLRTASVDMMIMFFCSRKFRIFCFLVPHCGYRPHFKTSTGYYYLSLDSETSTLGCEYNTTNLFCYECTR